MVSHLSNGALRASLTSTPRACCSASASVSTRSRVTPPRPRSRPRPRSATPYSSYAFTREAPHDAHSRSQWQTRSPPGASLRGYATASKPQPPRDIAVLGGGLTGLTTAYYLTCFHPAARITIYEAQDRLGGWVDTERVEVKTQEGKTATISFERGARAVSPQTTLMRWEDFVLYDLILRLGLRDQPNAPYVIPKDDPLLGTRYIYYPDHLVELPGSLPSLREKPLQALLTLLRVGYSALTEPLFKGLLLAVARMDTRSRQLAARSNDKAVVPERAIADYRDVSVGDFLVDVFGRPDLVHNVVSAMFHGIWGGDVWKLSAAESTLQSLFFQLRTHGMDAKPVKPHDFLSGLDVLARNPAVSDLIHHYGPNFGYLGFHGGFSTLTDALVGALEENDNVTIKTGTPITAIRYVKGGGKATVTSEPSASHEYDKVISSLFGGTLAKLAGDALPALKRSTAVTIQIVNLWYPDPNLLASHPGFGYLIPQSVPADKNPHAALGVIFDSNREAAAGTPEYTSAPGTKLTVMLGGHYWDYLDAESWPDAEQAAAMAKDTVERQLGIPATEPVFVSSKVCRECIPQHLVGHRAHMAQAHAELYESFRGTLAVVGSSYTSPGVLPSLKAARDMALRVAGDVYREAGSSMPSSQLQHVGETGLARFHDKNETVLFSRLSPGELIELPRKQKGGD